MRVEGVLVDENSVAGEVPSDHTRDDEAFGLSGDHARVDHAVAVEGDVEHARASTGAPDVDDPAVQDLRGIVDVERDPSDQSVARAPISPEGDSCLQGGATHICGPETMPVGIEERPGVVVDAVGQGDVELTRGAERGGEPAEVLTWTAPSGTVYAAGGAGESTSGSLVTAPCLRCRTSMSFARSRPECASRTISRVRTPGRPGRARLASCTTVRYGGLRTCAIRRPPSVKTIEFVPARMTLTLTPPFNA